MERDFMMGEHYTDLKKHTSNFSEENWIGRFQYGDVYHGSVDWGCKRIQPVTVKIWDTCHMSNSAMRDNELRLMREVCFLRNEDVKCLPGLVKLCGFKNDGEHLGVIYDFRALDTVRNRLCRDDFTWLQRIKVALWFARLLKFFHRRNPPYGPFLLHYVDTALILLDEDYIPKLFDFSSVTGGGIFPDIPQYATESPCGTAGDWTTQDDVFAFGLLLLSLISKKVISKEEAMESLMAPDFKWTLNEWKLSKGSLVRNKKMRLTVSFEADPHYHIQDGLDISSLAVQCLHSSPNERPSMMQVVRFLQKLQVVQSNRDFMDVKPMLGNRSWEN